MNTPKQASPRQMDLVRLLVSTSGTVLAVRISPRNPILYPDKFAAGGDNPAHVEPTARWAPWVSIRRRCPASPQSRLKRIHGEEETTETGISPTITGQRGTRGDLSWT